MTTLLWRRLSWRHRAVAALGAAALAITGIIAAPSQALAYDQNKGPNPSNKVTLTFDDCPKSLSQFRSTVLAAERLDIALVLFPTGNCVSSGQIDLNFARAHGHYVFNHSVNHPDLRTLSKSGVMRELGSPGVVTSYGRPPYGAINSTVASGYAAVGMKPWLWNVDTNDWRGRSTSQLISYVSSTAKAGDSVLMHMQWNGFNETALAGMKAGLARRGIHVCRNYPGTTPVRPAQLNCDGGTSTPPTPTDRFGDLSGDGRGDLLVTDTRGRLLMYPTRANLTLATGKVVGQGWGQMTWMKRVPDVTGDGRTDLLASRKDGALFFYAGLGGGKFGPAKQVGSGWATMGRLTVVPDVTGDKRPELFGRSRDGKLHRYTITATGVRHAGQVGTGWGGIRILTTVGDTSGDGRADLLAISEDGSLLAYTLTSGGAISKVNKVGRGWTSFTTAHSPGDLNRDGRRDLVGKRSDGRLFGYTHRGGGQFSAATTMGTGWNSINLYS